jgi:hypothetical protein
VLFLFFFFSFLHGVYILFRFVDVPKHDNVTTKKDGSVTHSDSDHVLPSLERSITQSHLTSVVTPTSSGDVMSNKDQSPYYLEQIKFMKNDDRNTLFVNYGHIFKHDLDLAQTLIENYYRFEPALKKGLKEIVRKYHPVYEMDADKRHYDFWVSFHNMMTTYT